MDNTSIKRAVRAQRVLLLNNVDPMVHSKDLEVSLPVQFALWKYLDWCQFIGMATSDVHQLFVCDQEYCNVAGGSHLVITKCRTPSLIFLRQNLECEGHQC